MKLFSDKSVIWCVAAGTVVRGSFVERDGYGLYGWVLKGAKNNTRLWYRHLQTMWDVG